MPMTLHIFFVPDGNRTWVAIGGDAAALGTKVATVLPNGDDAKKLGKRPGLEGTHDAKMGSGGFFELEAGLAAVDQLGAVAQGDVASIGHDVDDLLRAPHKGATPLPFSLTAQSSPSALVMTFSVPKAAIEDIVSLVAGNIASAPGVLGP